MRLTCSQGVTNKWLKRALHQLKQFCAENGLETFRANCWNLFNDIQFTTNMLRKLSGLRLLTSDKIDKMTNYLHLNCVEYGLQKWFNPPHRLRVKRLTYSHSVTKPVNMTRYKWWNSCIGIFISSEYGFKHNLHQINKFVCLKCIWSLQCIWIEFGLETWLVNRDEIIVVVLDTSTHR